MTIPPDAIQNAQPWPDNRRELFPKLPPEERFAGSLDGTPSVYFNPANNVATRMPEEVIRSYLVDPYMYNDWVWCNGMQDNARQADLVWVETGERLSDYFARLRANAKREGNVQLVYGVPIVLAGLGALTGFVKPLLGYEPKIEAMVLAGLGLALGIVTVVLARMFGWR